MQFGADLVFYKRNLLIFAKGAARKYQQYQRQNLFKRRLRTTRTWRFAGFYLRLQFCQKWPYPGE